MSKFVEDGRWVIKDKDGKVLASGGPNDPQVVGPTP